MRTHDVVVIGAGSGNAVIDEGFSSLDVAIVADGPFGGTCLNRGCIPSKMLIRAAEVADTVRDAGRYGVDARLSGVRWRDVRDRIFGRLDEQSAQGRQGREDEQNITVYDGTARFVGSHRLRIETADGPVDVTAERFVIAAGGRPVVPPPVAESGLPYETSDTVMRLDELPRTMVVVGGGYIAAELATAFSAFGVDVSIVEQTSALLAGQDEDVVETFTSEARKRFDLHLGREVVGVEGQPGALQVKLDDGSMLAAELLLVAVGRQPNSDRLAVDKTGVETTEDGRVVVDEYQRTAADGIFALGDICTPVPLKHVANREAEVVSHNLKHPDDLIRAAHDVVPSAIFTRPQIAAVGLTEQECRDRKLAHRIGKTAYADVAYGWALEDETGFCKVIAEPDTGKLLGAHIVGPQAATLIQPLVLAMTLGLDATAVANTPYWPHPALTEVVENALLDLAD
ncbi:mycothione reductase [Kribbella italica]|uniref:Mycothione reductase n=1 Tax=Kribbella italica TaxID=1540520 RepID=A0A7W9J5R3_9ACTN|nr:mycothione reductase [Kribbella italica]